jgi:hypothetical protein
MENKIEIYLAKSGIEVKVKIEQETVWLDAHLIARLFSVNRPAIVKHIQNIYKSNELLEDSTCSILEQVALDGKRRKMNVYNLDIIISVGYRVNSKEATQFRQWATQRLKDYLVQGYAINEKRLQEATSKFQDLNNAVKLATKAVNKTTLTTGEAKGILGVIKQYAYALETLDKYDHQKLTIETLAEETEVQKLTYKNAIQQIRIWRDFQKAGSLFGNEKVQSFRSSLETIYQNLME